MKECYTIKLPMVLSVNHLKCLNSIIPGLTLFRLLDLDGKPVSKENKGMFPAEWLVKNETH